MEDMKEIIKKTSVKDEVSSVLLSSMIGFIIKSWEGVPLKTPKVDSEETKSSICQISEDDIIVTADNEIEKLSVQSTMSSFYKNRKRSSLKSKQIKQNSFDKKSTELSSSPLPIYQSTGEPISQNIESFKRNTMSDKSSQTQSMSKDNESDDILTNFISSWRFIENDQNASICFKQGNKYEGPLSKCLMHGKGKYTWQDGSVYEGDFYEGEITGKGILIWPDQSWYEGDFYKGYRHGYGLLVLSNDVSYVGSWFLGQKHGLGLINYKDPQIQQDNYNGEWKFGLRDGTGFRQYASGARYAGQWEKNCRHGLGTMVWTNNDNTF
uniref:MORN repeat-containing protein 5 n=1 Tax=Clastoptera arizonana TaxID=38151 RepID=A0A1B6C591_9HEMI